MSELIDRLRTEVEKKGLTFNRIERECGLGNGTIKRWNDQSPRLNKLVIVAQYVGVSLDYLVFGALQTEESPDGESNLAQTAKDQGLLCDGSPLEGEEADLVAMYRLLPSHAQEDMFDQLYCLYRKYAERKRESIYWTYKADKLKQEGTAASDDGSQDGIA